jgi:hypothetical protein
MLRVDLEAARRRLAASTGLVGLGDAQNQGEGARSIWRIVSGVKVPSRSSKRVRATARMLRQTLAVFTPSVGETCGRSGVFARARHRHHNNELIIDAGE